LAEYLKQVQLSGKRARDLVSQLLTFSRTQNILLTKLPVPELVEEVTKMLRPMLPSSIEIKLDIENDLPPIMGNAVQLQQVLTNLLINARDAMEGHGLVTVELRFKERFNVCTSCHQTLSGQFVEVTVRDNGNGMAEDVLSRIFEPFMTTKDIGKGSGMGLSMVHGIVHAHGGHILVESSLNEYTAFHILLPAAKTQSLGTIESQEMATPPIETTKNNSHILVVDDERAVAGFLSEFLESKGYKVTALNDSEQALQQFAEDPGFFDLVLTDQTMPKMTGAEMAKAMLALRADIPIVLCTGYSELINEERAQSLGIQGYMLKPVDSTKLFDMVESLLTQSLSKLT
jgi:CheY-like chemotaxis protein/two-component sensor histidine kinase